MTAVLFPTAREARGVTLDRAVPADAAEVPILHLVLDEFIGIEGIPSDIPGGADLRDELKRFFVENGFRLYGGAYSQTSETQHAMAALLNGQPFPSQRTAFEEGDGRTSWRLPRNLWFERLAAKGYAIQVYDNSWLGYCAPENRQIERCYLAPSNSIKFMERLKIPAWDKARVILSAYLELSSMSTFLGEVANLPIYRLGALASGDIFDDLARAIGNTDHGRLFFAHLLSPHYSYVYEPGCQVKPDSRSWTNRRLPFRGRDEAINTPRSRAERYVAYFAQVRCVKRQLQGLFGELRAAGRYDDLTIILHGDHGSRLAIWDPIAAHGYRLSDRDVIDSFSTLYAVKKPGLRPGYDATVRSIQGLFAEMFLGTPLRPNLGDVVLRGTQRLDEDFGAAERFRRFPADGF